MKWLAPSSQPPLPLGPHAADELGACLPEGGQWGLSLQDEAMGCGGQARSAKFAFITAVLIVFDRPKGEFMRTIQVRFRQLITHGHHFYALDIRGNLWLEDKAAPQGWRRVSPPTIEVSEPEPVTQIPARIQFPTTVHFTNETRKNYGQNHRTWSAR